MVKVAGTRAGACVQHRYLIRQAEHQPAAELFCSCTYMQERTYLQQGCLTHSPSPLQPDGGLVRCKGFLSSWGSSAEVLTCTLTWHGCILFTLALQLGGTGLKAPPSLSTPTSGCGWVHLTSAAQVVQIGTLTANPHLPLNREHTTTEKEAVGSETVKQGLKSHEAVWTTHWRTIASFAMLFFLHVYACAQIT